MMHFFFFFLTYLVGIKNKAKVEDGKKKEEINKHTKKTENKIRKKKIRFFLSIA